MSYICQNNTCAIAISKAAFPVPMNCPVCQQPLVQAAELINDDFEKSSTFREISEVLVNLDKLEEWQFGL